MKPALPDIETGRYRPPAEMAVDHSARVAADHARRARRLRPGGMLRVGLLASCSHHAIAMATGERK